MNGVGKMIDEGRYPYVGRSLTMTLPLSKEAYGHFIRLHHGGKRFPIQFGLITTQAIVTGVDVDVPASGSVTRPIAEMHIHYMVVADSDGNIVTIETGE